NIKFFRRVLRRLQYWASWRCQEPVLVFESDDWGLRRRASSVLLEQVGKPGQWADEELETPDDLEKLYSVLEQYRDPHDRPACFVANFVMAVPDFEGIARSSFTTYVDIPLGEASAPSLKAKWLEGYARRVFFPQYHGRAHLYPDRWLQDLRDDVPGARLLFEAGCVGGLSLLDREGWRYHSEYMNWKLGQPLSGKKLQNWLQSGLASFQDLFGFRSQSTIAPHYIFTRETLQAWRQGGIRFIQGTNYELVRLPDGNYSAISATLGQRWNGLMLMSRTAKFEPRPQRADQGLNHALSQMRGCFATRIPAVVDTHRINYSGAWRDSSVQALETLLSIAAQHRPYVLTTVELGEAILNNGAYCDVFTGKRRQLTSLDTPARRALRYMLQVYHSAVVANAEKRGLSLS
ncbi:MAG TPA: hypothetical protein VMT34_16315, partial [Aggregatilineales bacterium]|nr:hypothetical protein [Aggregatilineales bacterium]